MNVYPQLPKTNCGICSAKVCMSFAVQLCERNVSLEECTPLFEEAQYKENLIELKKLLATPVKEVLIGNEKNQIKIGGELVLRRHELRYINNPAIAVVVNDDDLDEALMNTARTNNFSHTYIGMQLKLDMVAIRSLSNDPKKFEEAVKAVSSETELPLILWSLDPTILEKGLNLISNRRPLLYAATQDNWKEMGELALKYRCPLSIYAPNNLKLMRSMSKTLMTMGIVDLALDAGCMFGEGIPQTINNLGTMRTSAILGEDELLGFPLIGTPNTIKDGESSETDIEISRWKESVLASMMILRYTDLIMVSNPEVWTALPLVMLANNIYNDPRKPVSVEPGLRPIADPNEDSPVFLTANFALTYYTVLSDIEKIPNYLLVVDTEGTSVESAVAGRKMTADTIADMVKSSGIEDKIKHRTMIIPGFAARLKGEIEDATKWDVIVGSRDSSEIPKILKEKWEGQDHTPGWSYK